MDIFILTFRAASTQVLCFAWIMAVVQRVNQAVIFPATLKATELTDSHTDSCGSLTTRCHIVNCEDWRDVMAHDAKPSSHLPHFLRPEGSSGSLRPDVVHENLHLLSLMSLWECCGGTGCCKMMPALKFCQDLSACVYLVSWGPRAKLVFSSVSVCHSDWIGLGYGKKVLESAFVHEYQLCRALFCSDRETGNIKGSWWHEKE